VLVAPLVIAFLAQVISTVPAKPETWEWDSKAPICTLKQRNEAGEAAVTIERTPGNEETELLITLPAGAKLGRGHLLDATIRTNSGREFVGDVSVWRHSDKDHGFDLYVDSPDPTFIESLSGTPWLEISHPKIQTVRVPIHVPAKIVATLRDCEDTTMLDWGIDAVAWRNLRSRPLPLEHVRERFGALDYPAAALAANVEADAVARLDIAIDGTVTKCATVNPGLPVVFETASCKVLKGAKFRPATDVSGKPTSAPVLYDVRFRIGN